VIFPGQRIGYGSAVIILVFSLGFGLITNARAQQNTWDELNAQVDSLYGQGKFVQAVPVAQQLVDFAEKSFGADAPNVASSLNKLAVLYEEVGNLSDAEPLYQRSLKIREQAGANNPDIAASLNNLGALYADQGKYSEAQPLYERALAIREKALDANNPDLATSLNNLAVLYDLEGRESDALLLYKRALAIREKVFAPDHPEVAKSLMNLAGLYRDAQRYEEAEPLYRRLVAIDEKTTEQDGAGDEPSDLATTLDDLGSI
jgi:tetratricopeptide (TPR) repeat protein